MNRQPPAPPAGPPAQPGDVPADQPMPQPPQPAGRGNEAVPAASLFPFPSQLPLPDPTQRRRRVRPTTDEPPATTSASVPPPPPPGPSHEPPPPAAASTSVRRRPLSLPPPPIGCHMYQRRQASRSPSPSRSPRRSSSRRNRRQTSRSPSPPNRRAGSEYQDRRRYYGDDRYDGKSTGYGLPSPDIKSPRSPAWKAPVSFLGSVAAATFCVDRFWPKGMAYREGDAWADRKEEQRYRDQARGRRDVRRERVEVEQAFEKPARQGDREMSCGADASGRQRHPRYTRHQRDNGDQRDSGRHLLASDDEGAAEEHDREETDDYTSRRRNRRNRNMRRSGYVTAPAISVTAPTPPQEHQQQHQPMPMPMPTRATRGVTFGEDPRGPREMREAREARGFRGLQDSRDIHYDDDDDDDDDDDADGYDDEKFQRLHAKLETLRDTFRSLRQEERALKVHAEPGQKRLGVAADDSYSDDNLQTLRDKLQFLREERRAVKARRSAAVDGARGGNGIVHEQGSPERERRRRYAQDEKKEETEENEQNEQSRRRSLYAHGNSAFVIDPAPANSARRDGAPPPQSPERRQSRRGRSASAQRFGGTSAAAIAAMAMAAGVGAGAAAVDRHSSDSPQPRVSRFSRAITVASAVPVPKPKSFSAPSKRLAGDADGAQRRRQSNEQYYRDSDSDILPVFGYVPPDRDNSGPDGRGDREDDPLPEPIPQLEAPAPARSPEPTILELDGRSVDQVNQARTDGDSYAPADSSDLGPASNGLPPAPHEESSESLHVHPRASLYAPSQRQRDAPSEDACMSGALGGGGGRGGPPHPPVAAEFDDDGDGDDDDDGDSRSRSSRSPSPSTEREPSVERREPSVERRQPRFERTRPSFERREPSYERREPSAERRQPRFERTRPSFASFERREPSYERRQPSVERRRPSFEGREPSFERREPSVERRQPRFERRRPSFDEDDMISVDYEQQARCHRRNSAGDAWHGRQNGKGRTGRDDSPSWRSVSAASAADSPFIFHPEERPRSPRYRRVEPTKRYARHGRFLSANDVPNMGSTVSSSTRSRSSGGRSSPYSPPVRPGGGVGGGGGGGGGGRSTGAAMYNESPPRSPRAQARRAAAVAATLSMLSGVTSASAVSDCRTYSDDSDDGDTSSLRVRYRQDEQYGRRTFGSSLAPSTRSSDASRSGSSVSSLRQRSPDLRRRTFAAASHSSSNTTPDSGSASGSSVGGPRDGLGDYTSYKSRRSYGGSELSELSPRPDSVSFHSVSDRASQRSSKDGDRKSYSEIYSEIYPVTDHDSDSDGDVAPTTAEDARLHERQAELDRDRARARRQKEDRQRDWDLLRMRDKMDIKARRVNLESSYSGPSYSPSYSPPAAAYAPKATSPRPAASSQYYPAQHQSDLLRDLDEKERQARAEQQDALGRAAALATREKLLREVDLLERKREARQRQKRDRDYAARRARLSSM